jgi:ATP-binding cassette, subfamily C, bacterial LapB
LVFDEPTNMMDELSENLFKKKVQGIIQDKTVIIITHKPSLLSIVDRLIVVEDGKIVADGPKEKIISAFGAKVKPTTVVNTVVQKRVINE